MSSSKEALPKRRAGDIVCESFADGTAVVVDERTSSAHSLDALSSQIWDLSDGRLSIAQIASEVGVPLATVAATVEQLGNLDLLETDSESSYTRRSVIFRTAQVGGGLAVAAGVINTMALPALAAAVSAVQKSVNIVYTGGATKSYALTSAGSTPITTASGTYYLSDTALSTTQPAAPYVKIVLAADDGTSTLTFQNGGNASAEASYGNGDTAAAAATSLVSGTPVSGGIPTGAAGLDVTIGT